MGFVSCLLLFLSKDDLTVMLFEFHFLEVPIPLKSGAPLLFYIMGQEIIILCSELPKSALLVSGGPSDLNILFNLSYCFERN